MRLVPLKRNEPEPLVRFETPPGQQMQAEFTYVRRGREPLRAGGNDGLLTLTQSPEMAQCIANSYNQRSLTLT